MQNRVQDIIKDMFLQIFQVVRKNMSKNRFSLWKGGVCGAELSHLPSLSLKPGRGQIYNRDKTSDQTKAFWGIFEIFTKFLNFADHCD